MTEQDTKNEAWYRYLMSRKSLCFSSLAPLDKSACVDKRIDQKIITSIGHSPSHGDMFGHEPFDTQKCWMKWSLSKMPCSSRLWNRHPKHPPHRRPNSLLVSIRCINGRGGRPPVAVNLAPLRILLPVRCGQNTDAGRPFCGVGSWAVGAPGALGTSRTLAGFWRR